MVCWKSYYEDFTYETHVVWQGQTPWEHPLIGSREIVIVALSLWATGLHKQCIPVRTGHPSLKRVSEIFWSGSWIYSKMIRGVIYLTWRKRKENQNCRYFPKTCSKIWTIDVRIWIIMVLMLKWRMKMKLIAIIEFMSKRRRGQSRVSCEHYNLIKVAEGLGPSDWISFPV